MQARIFMQKEDIFLQITHIIQKVTSKSCSHLGENIESEEMEDIKSLLNLLDTKLN
jgi:hypothetical protein